VNALTRCIVALSLLAVAACAAPGSAIPPTHAAVTASASAARVHEDTALMHP
jgi:hypothetical protein